MGGALQKYSYKDKRGEASSRMEDMSIGGKTKSKKISSRNKICGRGLGSSGSGQVPVAGFYEDDNYVTIINVINARCKIMENIIRH
jgi:hypothetical protein